MAADLAIVNARVRTLDPARPFASAVAVQDGTIVAVGDDARCASTATRAPRSSTRAATRWSRAWSTRTCTRSGAPSWRAASTSAALRTKAEVLAALAAGRPQRGWLFAWGLDYDAAPTPREIGEAVRGAAAFVRLSDLHTALASPRALELAQVTGPHAVRRRLRGRLRRRRPDGRAARARRAGPGAARRAAACAGPSCAPATSRSCGG